MRCPACDEPDHPFETCITVLQRKIDMLTADLNAILTEWWIGARN